MESGANVVVGKVLDVGQPRRLRIFPVNFAADYIDPNRPVNFVENYSDSLFPHPPVRHRTRRSDMRPNARLPGSCDCPVRLYQISFTPMPKSTSDPDPNDRKQGDGTSSSKFHPVLRWIRLLLIAGLVLYVGLNFLHKRSPEKAIHALVESEELILALTPKLKSCAKSVQNREFPDLQCEALFADKTEVIDTGAAGPQQAGNASSVGVKMYDWPVASTTRFLRDKDGQLQHLWRPLAESVDRFVDTRFYFVEGHFTNDRQDEFHSVIGFHGLAQRRSGSRMDVEARQSVVWRNSSGDASTWKIVKWELTELQTTEADRLLFSERLADAIPDKKALSRARRSLHEQKVKQLITQGGIDLPVDMEPEYFRRIANGQHPAVSTVDLDGDGFDDLFVGLRWGPSLLLHNRGDGTFEEIAIRAGLAIENITSAIFADFDNDGDKDAFLGRYLRRSLYLINEEGHFVDKSADLVATPLPYLVSSISAADYNKDGLMDVYLSTYGFPGGTPLAKVWAPKFLEPRDAEEVTRRMYGPERKKYYHRYLSAVGPPNLLLVNQGDGKFAVAPENSRLAVWLHSFQSAWSDFDRDGDPDVYVSSDFGPDSLFRNDLDGGFVDVTREQGGEAMMGFGMGAS